MLRAALAFMRNLNLVYSLPMNLTWVAEGCVRQGDFDEAGRTLTEALSLFDRGSERWFEPECWRVKAHLQIANGEGAGAAVVSLRKSIDVAKASGSRSFALRSTLALARILASQPQLCAEPAGELLQHALSAFRQDADRADQREARALLATFSATGRTTA